VTTKIRNIQSIQTVLSINCNFMAVTRTDDRKENDMELFITLSLVRLKIYHHELLRNCGGIQSIIAREQRDS